MVIYIPAAQRVLVNSYRLPVNLHRIPVNFCLRHNSIPVHYDIYNFYLSAAVEAGKIEKTQVTMVC